MTSTLAACAGVLTLALVLVLGSLGRRPVRRVPSATPDVPAPARRHASRRTPLVLAAALLTGVATAAAGPFPVVVVGGIIVLMHRRRGRAVGAARQRAVEAAVPDAVELLVLCIHAGCSPTQAVAVVAARAPPALRPMFTDVELGLHRGHSFATALGALAPIGALGREVAAAIAAADRDGTALAPVLDRLAGDARAARRRIAEAEARRLPVRLTFPLVACTLPAFVLLAIAPAVLGALSTLRATAP